MASSEERSGLLNPQHNSMRRKQGVRETRGGKYVPDGHGIRPCTKGSSETRLCLEGVFWASSRPVKRGRTHSAPHPPWQTTRSGTLWPTGSVSCPASHDGLLGRTGIGIQVSCHLAWVSLCCFTPGDTFQGPQRIPDTADGPGPRIRSGFPARYRLSHFKEAISSFDFGVSNCQHHHSRVLGQAN